MARRKKNNNSLYLSVLLAIVAVALLVVLLIISLPSDKNDVSEESSKTELSVPAESSEDSQPDTPSVPEISEESEISQEVSVDYEEYIGVEYKIDVTDYLQYIDPDGDYSVLVNLSNPLSEDYEPDNLIVSQYMRKDGRKDQKLVFTAEMALRAMMAEAAEYGITDVTITSAYRDAKYQAQLFNGYVADEMSRDKSLTKAQAEAIVLTYSMKPGCSEHQTGLCCDMHNQGSATQAFGKTEAAKWLAANSYRFGFILRYAADKEDITGVEWEPWHFRFVGRELATYLYQNNLCLEEYYASQN